MLKACTSLRSRNHRRQYQLELRQALPGMLLVRPSHWKATGNTSTGSDCKLRNTHA